VIYDIYEKGRFYSIGVDVVEGKEDGDFAVITVIDRLTKSVAATYWSRIDEVSLARVVRIISDYYSVEPGHHTAPWTGIEVNGPGLATFDWAVALEIPNLFMAPRYDVSQSGVSYKKGWRTDTSSRPELVAGVKSWLIHRMGHLNNHRLIGELMSFVYSKTGKPQAKAGTHDDMVMSFGIALQVDEIAPLPEDYKPLGRPTHEDYTVNDWESYKVEPDPTPQERCMGQALAEQKKKLDLHVQYHDFMEDLL
jgi:hypothetical protein